MEQHPHTTHTDDTVLDLPVASTDPTTELPTRHGADDAHGAPARPSHRNRRLVAAALALAVLTGAAVVALGTGSSTSAPAAGGEGRVAGLAVVPTTTPPVDPQADLPEAQPEPPAAPGVLTLNTSVIWLLEGDYDASFTVRNDGGSPIDWEFHGGIGAIGASPSSGTLAPGESTVVSFSINPFQLADGPFVFGNQIVGGGSVKGLTIHGVKTPIVVNPDLPQLDLDMKA